MKTHYRSFHIDREMPLDLKLSTYKDSSGALCGYMRKNVTFDINKVTCFYCNKALGIKAGVAHRTTKRGK